MHVRNELIEKMGQYKAIIRALHQRVAIISYNGTLCSRPLAIPGDSGLLDRGTDKH